VTVLSTLVQGAIQTIVVVTLLSILRGALQTIIAQFTRMGFATTGEGSYASEAPVLTNERKDSYASVAPVLRRERKEAMPEPSEPLAESIPTIQDVLNAIHKIETRVNARLTSLESRISKAPELLEMILSRVKAMCYG
jgi:hypothetical protein